MKLTKDNFFSMLEKGKVKKFKLNGVLYYTQKWAELDYEYPRNSKDKVVSVKPGSELYKKLFYETQESYKINFNSSVKTAISDFIKKDIVAELNVNGVRSASNSSIIYVDEGIKDGSPYELKGVKPELFFIWLKTFNINDWELSAYDNIINNNPNHKNGIRFVLKHKNNLGIINIVYKKLEDGYFILSLPYANTANSHEDLEIHFYKDSSSKLEQKLKLLIKNYLVKNIVN